MIKRYGMRDKHTTWESWVEMCETPDGDYYLVDDVEAKLRAFDEIRALIMNRDMITDADTAWSLLEEVSNVISVNDLWSDK